MQTMYFMTNSKEIWKYEKMMDTYEHIKNA